MENHSEFFTSLCGSVSKTGILNNLQGNTVMYFFNFRGIRTDLQTVLPPTNLTPNHQEAGIIPWWNTCKNEAWLNFFLITKKTWINSRHYKDYPINCYSTDIYHQNTNINISHQNRGKGRTSECQQNSPCQKVQ